LPNFPAERISRAAAVIAPRPTEEATGEAARLLWNLQRLPGGLAGNAGAATAGELSRFDDAAAVAALFPSEAALLGEPAVIELRGRVVGVDAVRVPQPLAELVELSRVYRLRLALGREEVRIAVPRVPQPWLRTAELDEAVVLRGLLVRVPSATRPGEGGQEWTLFAPEVRWSPGQRWPLGWRLLAAEGLDAGLLAGVSQRMRKPLLAADEASFYGVLRVAASLGGRPATLQRSHRVATVDLLREPEALVGRWIEVSLEIARVTRVEAATGAAAERLGSDDYWQLDAFGKLDGVRVELAAENEAQGPLVFENQFPVSVAAVERPAWLRERLREGITGGARVDTRMVRENVVVRGFFYRLWTYRSDFTESRGGRQVAPLILAAEIARDRRGLPGAGPGPELFGILMAGLVVAALLVTTLVLWRVGRTDREIRARRRGWSS
jgi:hypothetical protein